MISGAAIIEMSARPSTISRESRFDLISTYSTSENPSKRMSSSASNCGARQIEGAWIMRILVTSGGGSANAVRGNASNAAAPIAEAFTRNSLRPVLSFSGSLADVAVRPLGGCYGPIRGPSRVRSCF